MAESQGRTADDLAADALKRYLTHEWLAKLDCEGMENRKRYGLKTDEEVEAYVDRVIHEYRSERRSR